MDKINKHNSIFLEDISSILNLNCNWLSLKEKTILITGGTGLIGTILIEMFCLLNKVYSLNLKLIIVSRKKHITDNSVIQYLVQNVNDPFDLKLPIDYIIHAASNTHPLQYSLEPIETITSNVFGTYNLLSLASKNNNCKMIFISSVEIYGNDISNNNSGFKEDDMGYLNCNTLRACYNESKRLSETLCQAFYSQKKVEFVIARLCRCYGPTLKKDDSKALSQFLFNGIKKQDIILKSKGEQTYSYLYAADAASAIIFLMLNGVTGEAYNVSDKESVIKLKDLANLIAKNCNTKVIFDLPSETESKGYSKSDIAILNSEKINKLGWKAQFSLEEGIKRTLSILKLDD